MTDKPCPFCGSTKLEVWEGIRGTTIECMRCGATGPQAFDDIEALAWWNEASRPRGKQRDAQRTRCKTRVRSLAQRRARVRARELAEADRRAAPKRAQEREYTKWARDREAWLRGPVEEDTVQ
jgi:Lar family restriction alleviation protein